jgi:peptidoglycan/LPS O-acetylase OafA/YrhL
MRGPQFLRAALPGNPGAFRLLLAMLVFVHHFSSFGVGTAAVLVFFILSGFWLQRMWANKYSRTRSAYLTYLVSRLWRLAPVMMLCTLAMLAVDLGFGINLDKLAGQDPLPTVITSVLLLGYSWLDYMPLGPAWSLDIEMRFYLLAPLLSVVVARDRRLALFGICTAASLASFWLTERPLLANYIVFFLIGINASIIDWKPDTKLALASAALVVLSLAVVFVSPWRSLLIGGAHPGALFVYNPVFCAWLALCTVPLAIFTVHRPSEPTDRMLADLSYIIYLLHWLGVEWFQRVKGPFLERLEVAAVCFAVIPLVSWLVWRYFDQPINRARDRWVKARIVG